VRHTHDFLLLFPPFAVHPRVRSKPSSGKVVAKKGSLVTLECDASGNPVPRVTWTREVRKSVERNAHVKC